MVRCGAASPSLSHAGNLFGQGLTGTLLGQTDASTFLDVLYGNNSTIFSNTIIQGYRAGPGYDNITGLGVP